MHMLDMPVQFKTLLLLRKKVKLQASFNSRLGL